MNKKENRNIISGSILDILLSQTIAFVEATEVNELSLQKKYSDLEWKKEIEVGCFNKSNSLRQKNIQY
jgi:hypothetical protein